MKKSTSIDNENLPEIQVSFQALVRNGQPIILTSSQETFDFALSIWDLDTIELYEEFKTIYLNRANRVIGYRTLGRGDVSGVVVNIRLIILLALKCNASGLILCHNHPSGVLKTSQQDDKMTADIYNAAQQFHLKLLDHLIITRTSYFSYCDEGRILSTPIL